MKYIGINREIYDAIELLPEKKQLDAFDTLFKYEITGKIKTKDATVESFILKYKQQIDDIVLFCKAKENYKLNRQIRNSAKYKEWRKSVFARDKYICQTCGKIGGNLNAHHIRHFATDISKRFDVDNGITLCYECHKKVHSKEII